MICYYYLRLVFLFSIWQTVIVFFVFDINHSIHFPSQKHIKYGLKRTALINASRNGYEDSVIMLLEAGADQLITDYVSKNIIFISFQFVFLFYYFLLIIFTIFYLYSIDSLDR